MAISISDAAQNAGCDAVVDLADGGSSAGYMEIRSGSKPADPDSAASGDLLATITLGDPAFGNSGASNVGEAILADTPLEDDDPEASGTAGWFRIFDSDDNAIIDGTIGGSGSGEDMELNTTTVTEGVPFRVTAGTITLPLDNS